MLSGFPTAREHVLPIIIISVVCFITYWQHDNWVNIGQYQRDSVYSSEVWRLWSAHIFHTNLNHLLLNLGGLWLLWALHGEYYSWRQMTVFSVICGPLISISLWVFSSHLGIYVGLSGLLHGLFVWGACLDIYCKQRFGYALLVGLGIKLLGEQWSGPSISLGEWINATVAIDAHVFGSLAGAVTFICFMGMGWVKHDVTANTLNRKKSLH